MSQCRGPAIHVARPQLDHAIVEAARREEERKQSMRQEAKQRAEELLLGNLTQEQRDSWRQFKRFRVIGQDGETYELDCTRQHQNIRRIANGRPVEEFCIYLPGVPIGDNHLAQKFMLECDIRELKRIANVTRLRNHAG